MSTRKSLSSSKTLTQGVERRGYPKQGRWYKNKNKTAFIPPELGPRVQLPSVRQQHEVREQVEPEEGLVREQGRHHRQPHVRSS